MKVLVTGANGFLGFYLCKKLLDIGHEVVATSRGNCRLPFNGTIGFSYLPLDLASEDQSSTIIRQVSPDYIIHAAAMGKPDECEEKKELATQINSMGTFNLLQAASEKKIPFNYISTDFVFDGVAGNYSEDAIRNPINHYGKTKLEAENWVEKYSSEWSIVRTVLVYGKPMTGRSNLLSIVHEKLNRGETYQVVDDQVRTPTFVEDLVTGIISMMDKRAQGVFNICGEEVLTPYQMAISTANFLGLDASLLIRTLSSNFNQPARRPLITGLQIEKARSILGFSPSNFEEGLRKTFNAT